MTRATDKDDLKEVVQEGRKQMEKQEAAEQEKDSSALPPWTTIILHEENAPAARDRDGAATYEQTAAAGTGAPAAPRHGGVLRTAEELINGDRQDRYGSPEESFGLIAELWGAYLDRGISSTDVGAMMALLKIVRIRTEPRHLDSYVDACGYLALAAEVAEDG